MYNSIFNFIAPCFASWSTYAEAGPQIYNVVRRNQRLHLGFGREERLAASMAPRDSIDWMVTDAPWCYHPGNSLTGTSECHLWMDIGPCLYVLLFFGAIFEPCLTSRPTKIYQCRKITQKRTASCQLHRCDCSGQNVSSVVRYCEGPF